MGKQKKRRAPSPPSQTVASGVKPETMWLVAVVTFAVGFLAGVVFTIYKTPQQGAAGMAAAPQQAASADTGSQIEMLKQHLAHETDDLKSWIQLGNLCFDSGRHDEAVEAYEKALALDGDNPDVWTDLGVMYRRLGKPEKAVEAFDRAIALNSGHEVSRFNKGVVFMHDLERPEDAIRAWEELLEINPLARTPDGRSLDEQVTRFKQQLAGEKKPSAASGG